MKISIAMCTYNGARYLEQQLRSIEHQTVSPFELVICDDGSADVTELIVNRFRDSVSFPVFFHRNVLNLGSTRNFEQAIRYCRGDVIALCDQDDVWGPVKLAAMGAVLEGNPAVAGVFSNASLMNEHGDPLPGTLWQRLGFTAPRERAFSRDSAPDQLILRDTITGATLLFRASYIPLLLPIPVEWFHDGWIALLLASVAEIKPMAILPMTYRLHTQQQVGAKNTPLSQHLFTKKQAALAFHESQVTRFRLLLERLDQIASLQGSPFAIEAALFEKVKRKIRFFETRILVLRGSPIWRVPAAARLLPDYRLYEKGILSFLRDLIH